MAFNDFVHEYNLRNKTTSDTKFYQFLCYIGLNIVAKYLRDGPLESDIGVVNFHSLKGTYCVCYINENYFDSLGCFPPKKLFKFNIKQNGYWILFLF